jgi:hypothetical protein
MKPILPMKATLLAALVALCGCAAILPTHDVIRSLDGQDVDVVVAKGADRYGQLGTLVESLPFVIVLDSVIVGGEIKEPALVSTIASYMLGEALGGEWVPRVGDQRLIYGQGQAELIVHRGASDRYLVDLLGTVSLYLPLASAPGSVDGVEAFSFDVRCTNVPIKLEKSDTVTIFCELLPRNAVYSKNRPVFRRWEKARFHLAWEHGASPEARERAVSDFLANARGEIGPTVRLELKIARHEDGTRSIAVGASNAVELVLPNDLVAGSSALEQAAQRLADANPGTITRRGDDIFIRVGSFFLHDDTTGPSPLDPAQRADLRSLKRFRIPPPEAQAASSSSSAASK